MSDMTRREMLQLMAVLPLAGALDFEPASVQRAAQHARTAVQQPQPGQAPLFFTPAEMRTVRVLADLIIPRDARSGSATDAGVPEFIDFMMTDRPSLQIPVRGGLHWLDGESRERFDRAFADASGAEQTRILDDIAWPARAPETLSHGVAFFNQFRDLVASGFWSSKMGMEDLRFMGNTVVPVWNGCPDDAMRHLGVSYDA
jgi:hypothetical protein